MYALKLRRKKFESLDLINFNHKVDFSCIGADSSCKEHRVSFLSFYFRSPLACSMALQAVRTVLKEDGERREIDIKRYAKIEKVS